MAAAKKSTKKATRKTAAKRPTAKKATKRAPAKRAAKKSTARKATKRTAKKATKRTAAASVGNVVVASKVKDAVRSADIRMAGDFPEALNAEVHALIARATERAKNNGRGTVRPNDL